MSLASFIFSFIFIYSSCSCVLIIIRTFHSDEESVAIEEVRALGEAVQEVEFSVEGSDIDAVIDKTLATAAEVRTPEGRSLLM